MRIAADAHHGVGRNGRRAFRVFFHHEGAALRVVKQAGVQIAAFFNVPGVLTLLAGDGVRRVLWHRFDFGEHAGQVPQLFPRLGEAESGLALTLLAVLFLKLTA